MGGFYLAYENDYTDILLPSILHPCKSSLRGRGFSPTQRGRSVKNRSTNRKDKSNSVAKGGPKDPCTMGYIKETVRNGVGARMDIICLMLAGPSIRPRVPLPSPLFRLGFLDGDSQRPSLCRCVIAAGILNYWPLGCPLISNTPRFG